MTQLDLAPAAPPKPRELTPQQRRALEELAQADRAVEQAKDELHSARMKRAMAADWCRECGVEV